jgi:ribonuclease P protein component
VHVGIVVSRKVGNAVTRNRVRRRLREALTARMRTQPLPPGIQGVDLIVIARPSAAEAGYDDLRRSLERALERSRFP